MMFAQNVSICNATELILKTEMWVIFKLNCYVPKGDVEVSICLW